MIIFANAALTYAAGIFGKFYKDKTMPSGLPASFFQAGLGPGAAHGEAGL
jgi:hypothetical protein